MAKYIDLRTPIPGPRRLLLSVIVEPVLGEGGFIVPPREFMA